MGDSFYPLLYFKIANNNGLKQFALAVGKSIREALINLNQKELAV